MDKTLLFSSFRFPDKSMLFNSETSVSLSWNNKWTPYLILYDETLTKVLRFYPNYYR